MINFVQIANLLAPVTLVSCYLFQEDPLLVNHRIDLIKSCARELDKAKMIRFDEKTNFLYPTSLGRTASNFYIDFSTIEVCVSSTKYFPSKHLPVQYQQQKKH